MNLANKITLFRIVIAFVFMVFLFTEGVFFKVMALMLFLVAAASDFLDGFVAKRYSLESDFGKIMDPIADKILTIAAFMGFVEKGLVPAWMVVVIVMRELIITALRVVALRGGEVLGAGLAGKQKTVSQMVSIVFILVFIVIREAGVMWFGFWDASFEYWYKQAIFLLMLITVSLTIISGFSYLIANKDYLLSSRKGDLP